MANVWTSPSTCPWCISYVTVITRDIKSTCSVSSLVQNWTGCLHPLLKKRNVVRCKTMVQKSARWNGVQYLVGVCQNEVKPHVPTLKEGNQIIEAYGKYRFYFFWEGPHTRIHCTHKIMNLSKRSLKRSAGSSPCRTYNINMLHVECTYQC